VNVNQLAVFDIFGIVYPASLDIPCITFAKNNFLTIGDKAIGRFRSRVQTVQGPG